MDANGTRYHLLLGEQDWARCTEGGRPLSAVFKLPGGAEARRTPPASLAGARNAPEQASALAWNRQRGELTLKPRLFQFLAAPRDVRPSIDMRRGAVRDRYGNWYWIDESGGRILVNSEGTRLTTDFWPPDDARPVCESDADAGDFRPREAPKQTPSQFRGLALTDEHYLVAGVVEPAGLVFFDLHAGGPPQQIVWPRGIPFSPFDMTAAPDGGVLVLDREHKRLWSLDRHFNVIAEGQHLLTLRPAERDDFQPRDGSTERLTAAREFPEGVRLDASTPVAASDPVAVEALPDGTALVLDRNPEEDFCRIFFYRSARQFGGPASTEKMQDLIEKTGDASRFKLSGYDFAFLPAAEGAQRNSPGTVYIVAEDGNQSFAFVLSKKERKKQQSDEDAEARGGDVAAAEEGFELMPLPDYLPLRLFAGKGLSRADEQVYYDHGGGWIPLVEQRRPRYSLEATLLTPIDGSLSPSDGGGGASASPCRAFDGREPDCVWHRLMLDACIPPETEVSVYSRTANDERELSLAEWRPEPRLYPRGDGSELPFLREQPPAGYGTWELLFQRARGRFLQLKLELRGNGRTTPRLRALRAYYPRFSYLERYLPAVYREDAPSASFLDRYLANFEGIYTSIEDRVAAAQVLFDVRSAPPDALEWLAGWFGVVLDPTLDDEKRRLFIKYAMRFFQARGTIRGLQMALRLTLDDCADETIFDEADVNAPRARGLSQIRVVERFRTRRTPGVVFGDPTDRRGLSFIEQTARWLPVHGTQALHQRYTDFVRAAVGRDDVPPLTFSLIPHVDTGKAALTEKFARDTLGFVPTATGAERREWHNFLRRQYNNVTALNAAYKMSFNAIEFVPLPSDMPQAEPQRRDWRQFALGASSASAGATPRKLWQDYLARRYHNVAAFNQSRRTRWPSFELVSLPDDLPPDGRPLLDWYQFEGVVVPMRQTAHRFTLLLPLPPTATSDAAEQQRRLELARRVVTLEKPAHTIFDIKLYWALFRVGEARLGEDTVLDTSSRAPQLMPAAVLGQSHLAGTYIAPTHPQDVAGRQTLGFEQLGG